MKRKKYLFELVWLCFFCLVFFTPLSAYAALQTGNLGFTTSNQNMWGGGSSFVSSGKASFGLSWDESFYEGGYSGGVTTVIPGGCLPWWLGGRCWGGVQIDTTTGGHLSADTNGYIGVEAGYSIDSGSINAAYPVDVVLSYPDSSTVGVGETFTISSSYTVGSGAGFDTNFPEVQAYVDFIFDVYASAEAGFQVLGEGVTVGGTIIDVDVTQEIIGFNRDRDGDGDGDGDGALTILGQDTGLIGQDIAVGSVSGKVTIPNIDAVSNQTGPDTYGASGETDFLALELDADQAVTDIIKIATAGAVYIPLEGDIGDGLIGYNLLDIELGTELDIWQSFLFEPELWITLNTDLDDEAEYEFKAGTSIDLLLTDSVLDITPTYELRNLFTNNTDLVINPFLHLLGLEAYAFGYELGPLFNKTFDTDIPISVYSDSFALDFDSFTMASFSITADSSPEPVPEPATLLLLGTGLISLSGFARRRKHIKG